jgi:uncharacterized glyoxalase superfamily protein PhnB
MHAGCQSIVLAAIVERGHMKFDAIGVVVTDMPRAVAFYRLLGLEFPQDVEAGGHVETVLPGGIRLMFDSEDVMRSFNEEWTPPARPGPMSFAFLCDRPGDVDAAFDRLVDHGHEGVVAPFDAFWGQRYATVLDPDGNAVDLFAPLPDRED